MILLVLSVTVVLVAAQHPRWSWWPLAMVPWALSLVLVELHSLPVGELAAFFHAILAAVALVPTVALWGIARWLGAGRGAPWRAEKRRAVAELTLCTTLAIAAFSAGQSLTRPPFALFDQGVSALDAYFDAEASGPRAQPFSLRVERADEALALFIEHDERSTLVGTHSLSTLSGVRVRSHRQAACVWIARPKCAGEALCFDRWQSRGQLGAVAHHFAPPRTWLAMSLLAVALGLYARTCQRTTRLRWAASSALLCSLPSAGYLIACALNQAPWR